MTNSAAAISALVDNQATDLDLPSLLKQLDNPATQQVTLDKWRSYHLASSVLRGELPRGQALKFSQVDLSSRIAEQLAQEPLPILETLATKTKPAKTVQAGLANQWFRTTALAASVALAVLVGAQVVNLFQISPTSEQQAGIEPLQEILATQLPVTNLALLIESLPEQPLPSGLPVANTDSATWTANCLTDALNSFTQPPYLGVENVSQQECSSFNIKGLGLDKPATSVEFSAPTNR